MASPQTHTHRKRRAAKKSPKKKWSAKVTATSDAMDVEPGVFKSDDPKRIARSLKQSAEKSKRKKTGAFRSAMSLLVFYINRAGKSLSKSRRATLERAKDKLREQFGKR